MSNPAPAPVKDLNKRGGQPPDTKKTFVWRPGARKFTQDVKIRFLEEFVSSGLMYEAAEKVGVTGFTVLEHVKEDEGFASAYEEAKQLCIDKTLVREARRRALEGTDKPIVGGKDKDQIVAYEKVYSDRLHELLLKAERPEQYRENSKGNINISGGVLTLTAQPMQSTDWERTVDRQGNIIEGSVIPTIDLSTGQPEAIDVTPAPAAQDPAPADPIEPGPTRPRHRTKRIKHG